MLILLRSTESGNGGNRVFPCVSFYGHQFGPQKISSQANDVMSKFIHVLSIEYLEYCAILRTFE